MVATKLTATGCSPRLSDFVYWSEKNCVATAIAA